MLKMNKIFLMLFFVGLLLVGTVSATTYYVSTSSSGTGTGDSWANKKDFKTLNTGSLLPGDIVYIDGGTNGLIYERSPFVIYSRGTSDKFIKFTRGLEAGHNGQPTFRTNSTYTGSSILLEGAQYVEISGLKVLVNRSALGGITLTYRWNTNPKIWSHHINIINNDIEYASGTGIHLAEASDIKILHNRIYTGVIDTTSRSDAIWAGLTLTNLEVANNYFLVQNRATGSTAHKDFMQLNNLSGTIKIHHNYIRATTDWYQGVYSEFSVGDTELWIYNNIIDFTGTDKPGSMINVDGKNGMLSMYVYNNILIGTGQNNIGLYKMGNIYFKNNLVKLGLDTGYHIELSMLNNNYNNAHFDYNQYDIPSLSSGVPAGWTAWRGSAYGYQDQHSEVLQNPTNEIKLFSFVNAPSLDPEGYRLASGSSGIDEGTSVSGVVVDFVATSRPQGSAWDVGAYEFVSSTAPSYHPADLNTDGCVSLGEISTYVGRWLNGSVTLSQASSAVSEWMGGC